MDRSFGSSALSVLAPTIPGDLVACRALFAALGRVCTPVIHVRRTLAPLLDSLSIEVRPHDFMRGVSEQDADFMRELDSLTIADDAHVIDLIGSTATIEWLRRRDGTCTGFRMDPGEFYPYTDVVPWIVSAHSEVDRTHFAVRMLRVLQKHRQATAWPVGAFKDARFRSVAAPIRGRFALMPGSSRPGGLAKRMPLNLWIKIAFHLRRRGLTPVWFLGPDEDDLRGRLVASGDSVVDGSWSEVCTAHASCEVGVANDTAHMHLRAHLERRTLVLFRRDDIAEWGSYPSAITCLGPSITSSTDRAITEALDWIDGASL